jgi:phasin family protein
MLTQEQIAATRMANLDLLFGLSTKAVEGFERLAALNMQLMRATLADMVDFAQKLFSVKEQQDWLALQNSLGAPLADKMQGYSRQAVDIALATQAEFVRVAQAQSEACGRQMQTAVEDVAKNAPAGSEAAMSALNSAIAAANTLYETLQRAGQQAVKATQSNLDVAAAASKSAKLAANPVSQAR